MAEWNADVEIREPRIVESNKIFRVEGVGPWDVARKALTKASRILVADEERGEQLDGRDNYEINIALYKRVPKQVGLFGGDTVGDRSNP